MRPTLKLTRSSARAALLAIPLLALAPGPAFGQAPEAETEGAAAEAPATETSPRLEALIAERKAEEVRAAELSSALEELELAAETAEDSATPITLAEFEAREAAVDAAQREVTEATRGLAVATEALEAAAGSKAESSEAGDLLHRIVDERIALRRAALESARFAKKLADRRLALAVDDLASATPRVRITAEDFAKSTEQFDAREATLRRRIERAELARREAEVAWDAAQAQQATEPSRTTLSAARAELSLHQKSVALLGTELDRLDDSRTAVERRLQMLSTPRPDRATALEWLDAARTKVSEFERDLRLARADARTLEQELAALAPKGAASRRFAALESRLALLRRSDRDLQEAIDFQTRLISTLEQATGSKTLADRIGEAVESGRSVWNYEIGIAGDQVISVGKVVLAVLLMVIGLILARFVARLLENRILPRFGLDEGASHAFGELAFYALLVVAFLVSLQSVNIPLTAFAVVGGALAIGVGFGSQNIVNNFISGIILLAERPIKIGDLVQVDETYGNIERIGLRSTRVRTGENIHVIVPNSTFLETKVINWTHNDTQVRVSVTVGIAYGSPTREAEALILAAIAAAPAALERPAPVVLFTDFGDNALVFEAHFWARIRAQMERRKLESQVRFNIDDEFRKAGITIAFPQRDVHLDSLSPIEVRVVEEADANPDEDGAHG